MDSYEKLAIVANESQFESDGDDPSPLSAFHASQGAMLNSCGNSVSPPNKKTQTRTISTGKNRIPIHMAVLPGGKRIPLLKSMLTTACEMNCNYCTFRAGRNFRRVHFQPEELASIYMEVYRKRQVEGIFLSTGILSGGANTQNKLLDAAEILRTKLEYRGYLHIKIMPGAEKGQVLRAMQLGDRVSINLEAPNSDRLFDLAPQKKFAEQLVAPFHWIDDIRSSVSPHSAWDGRWPSSTTQFVVGAAGESDLEILNSVQSLSKTAGFARAYFEAFNPVPNTPLEHHPKTDPLRQHRLYQASFLMRDYGFDMEELSFNHIGNLPLERDPKQAYASENLSDDPIELNSAAREELLRVPGIGIKGAEGIIMARSRSRLDEISQVKKLGIHAERAAPYILLNGKRVDRQIALFEIHQ
jgi:predicted DNA-binding helix-hairpin-helix protein